MLGGLDPVGVTPYAVGGVFPDIEFQLVVDGVEVSGYADETSVRIQRQLGSRGTMSAAFIDLLFAWNPDVGDTVYVLFHGTPLFAGTIDDKDVEVLGYNAAAKARRISIRCVDFAQLLDRQFVTAHYEGASLKDIVTDIVTVQTDLGADPAFPTKVHDGISIGEIAQNGPIFAGVVNFPTVKVSDALRDLCEQAGGLNFRIDAYRRLHVFDSTLYRAPFSITDSNPRFMSLTVSQSRGQYRNRQILKAGHAITTTLVETLRGDGVRRTWDLGFELNSFMKLVGGVYVKNPFVDATTPNVSVLRNGVAQKTGVRGADKDGSQGTAAFFFQFGEKEIGQNSDETAFPVLGIGESLQVIYQGQFPFSVEAQSDTEIDARRAAEGGSGLYVNREDDEQANGDFAVEKADRLLSLFGRIPRSIPIKLQDPGLDAGQLLTLNLSLFGLNGDFLIDSIQISILRIHNGLAMQFEATALEGAQQETWVDFFRRQAEAGRVFSIRENEQLRIQRQFSDGTQVGPDVITDSQNSGASLSAYTNDGFTFEREGIITLSGVSVLGHREGRSRIGKAFGSP